MKTKYPVEAFAFAIAIFSSGMKVSFAAGILVIFAAVLAEFLKNLLGEVLPDWSKKACVGILTASVTAGAFAVSFAALSMPTMIEVWILAAVIGLLAAKHAFAAEVPADYDGMFYESAIVWGLWILLAVVREFIGVGKIFGFSIGEVTMQSKTFQQVFFGFLTAGLVLAAANGILKHRLNGVQGRWVVLPAAILARPFSTDVFGAVGGVLFTILLPIVLFWSVQKTLRFSRIGRTFRGLPAELLSMGFIYMILSIY